ncbi:hypothetical protein ACFSTD_23230 [Novosphingobium colocasiae]|uniref:Uncharacterized protein n=1 Tax=Novosphingobium colocasiae TaxID=1256513 RepID=A0A918PG02_9SPHN|nr:hypothetical protein [Novosphingobium colocasiae]GGZ07340.1 hypothetical protein GCM10011614_22830 [Novosphingobium colocasiae]
MHKLGEEIHLEEDEARGGSTPHIVRYILAISLALVILAMSATWISRSLLDAPSRGGPVTAEEHALGG